MRWDTRNPSLLNCPYFLELKATLHGCTVDPELAILCGFGVFALAADALLFYLLRGRAQHTSVCEVFNVQTSRSNSLVVYSAEALIVPRELSVFC